MTDSVQIAECASELLDAAREFQSAAELPGSHVAGPDALVSLEEALQAVSAAWYQVAADAVPRVVDRHRHDADAEAPAHNGLSHETEVRLVGTLHDVAAAFAACARACREAKRATTPIITGARAA